MTEVKDYVFSSFRVKEFFDYSKERENIRIQKESGLPSPWTTDAVLQENKFCNIFREDDKVTRLIEQLVRLPLEYKPTRLLVGVAAARWFNRYDTLLLIKDQLLNWSTKQVTSLIRARPGPYSTGAYIIRTPNGLDKLDGICWCVDRFIKEVGDVAEDWRIKNLQGELKLQDVHFFLKSVPFLGDFMAYEIVTDLRHTPLANKATDVMTWASAGPGAARGLCRLLNKPLDHISRTAKGDMEYALVLMQRVLALSQREEYWPKTHRAWEMREVEHTLCEYDKYLRVRDEGGKLRAKYKAT